jgi:hypothetical protein
MMFILFITCATGYEPLTGSVAGYRAFQVRGRGGAPSSGAQGVWVESASAAKAPFLLPRPGSRPASPPAHAQPNPHPHPTRRCTSCRRSSTSLAPTAPPGSSPPRCSPPTCAPPSRASARRGARSARSPSTSPSDMSRERPRRGRGRGRSPPPTPPEPAATGAGLAPARGARPPGCRTQRCVLTPLALRPSPSSPLLPRPRPATPSSTRTTFFISAASGLVGALLTIVFLPDTTGLSLDELDRLVRWAGEGRALGARPQPGETSQLRGCPPAFKTANGVLTSPSPPPLPPAPPPHPRSTSTC